MLLACSTCFSHVLFVSQAHLSCASFCSSGDRASFGQAAWSVELREGARKIAAIVPHDQRGQSQGAGRSRHGANLPPQP